MFVKPHLHYRCPPTPSRLCYYSSTVASLYRPHIAPKAARDHNHSTVQYVQYSAPSDSFFPPAPSQASDFHLQCAVTSKPTCTSWNLSSVHTNLSLLSSPPKSHTVVTGTACTLMYVQQIDSTLPYAMLCHAKNDL